jgi:hypothetical protein
MTHVMYLFLKFYSWVIGHLYIKHFIKNLTFYKIEVERLIK